MKEFALVAQWVEQLGHIVIGKFWVKSFITVNARIKLNHLAVISLLAVTLSTQINYWNAMRLCIPCRPTHVSVFLWHKKEHVIRHGISNVEAVCAYLMFKEQGLCCSFWPVIHGVWEQTHWQNVLTKEVAHKYNSLYALQWKVQSITHNNIHNNIIHLLTEDESIFRILY